MRNSHVVGFFRRICKLLWFGIKPVFVFDGGAPALKRQTITARKRRREGRRDDAVRTAGKLLAVQMQRAVEEEEEKRKRQAELERRGVEAVRMEESAEPLPSADQLVYVDEVGMTQEERQKSRKFYKKDAYHLPDLPTSIEGMGKPEDPRIMSVEELEEYARQFQSGEDINLYDFSKIDFEGEFFRSLPPADRYNILNAARLRSRLRMGLSKEQLEAMFPDRMAFSKFQIERVQERNHLTQRLMQEAGMTGTDLTLNGSARIAGERDREYILVKNEGVEGGWALGVVSREKDQGEIHKPIDVDELQFQYQTKKEEEEGEDEDFEDVPIEGLNRLPQAKMSAAELVARQRQLHDLEEQENYGPPGTEDPEEDSLFVDNPSADVDALFENQAEEQLREDEDEDLNRAIAMSLKSQHAYDVVPTQGEDSRAPEDAPLPAWTQKAVEQPKPVTAASGSMIAHMVNRRANAVVPKRRRSDASSDSDIDLGAALSAARKKKKTAPQVASAAVLVMDNQKNAFGGPLPFEKLDWRSSIFARTPEQNKPIVEAKAGGSGPSGDVDDDLAGGFEKEVEEEDAPRPLPPWMVENASDIRDAVRDARDREREINEEDRQAALEEENRRRKDAIIEIVSSDGESDVEIIDAPPQPLVASGSLPTSLTTANPPPQFGRGSETDQRITNVDAAPASPDADPRDINEHADTESPEPEFEDVPAAAPAQSMDSVQAALPEPELDDVGVSHTDRGNIGDGIIDMDGDLFVHGEDAEDDFSDPEDEELLAQMAEEAEEHARFASQLNNKSEQENQDAYERELKALRTQQKKDRRDADEVTQIMITECQALLRLFGIPYITAPMEAEAQCAELVTLGLVDGIVTDDSDTFLFGGTRVYKNMFNSNKLVECYLASDLEKELSLSREQLIALAQLLGSDYTEGLPGVGPVTAVEILSEFPGREGLEAFREWWQDVQNNNRPKEADAHSSFRKKFRKSQASKLFLPLGFPSPTVFDAYLKPEVDSNPEQFQWGVPDVDGLRRFLMSTIGWSQERTDEVLVPVIRDMNRREAEGTQSNITRYFEGGVGVGAKEAFAPRHRVQSSKRMVEAVNKLRANAVVEHLSESTPLEVAPASAGRHRPQAKKAVAVGQDEDDALEGVAEDDEAEAEELGRRKRKGKRANGAGA